jgi:hypothetical protein
VSSFTSPLLVEILQRENRIGRGLARLIKPFTYHVGFIGSGHEITVPADFVTDFASVPRLVAPFISPLSLCAKAAVLHDYLLYIGTNQHEAADIFLEAMTVLGVSKFKRTIMWLAVKYWPWIRVAKQ